MTRLELVTNGKELLFKHRNLPPAMKPLGKRQLEWLASKHPGIFRNRFQPLEKSRD
jgi:hypothetical protein